MAQPSEASGTSSAAGPPRAAAPTIDVADPEPTPQAGRGECAHDGTQVADPEDHADDTRVEPEVPDHVDEVRRERDVREQVRETGRRPRWNAGSDYRARTAGLRRSPPGHPRAAARGHRGAASGLGS